MHCHEKKNCIATITTACFFPFSSPSCPESKDVDDGKKVRNRGH